MSWRRCIYILNLYALSYIYIYIYVCVCVWLLLRSHLYELKPLLLMHSCCVAATEVRHLLSHIIMHMPHTHMTMMMMRLHTFASSY